VQIGSFGKKNNADKFAAGLAGEGYAVFVMAAKTSSGTVYRVNAGPRATRAEAEKLAATISQSGRSVMVFELDADANGGSR
jgi:cell division septation protein DedD